MHISMLRTSVLSAMLFTSALVALPGIARTPSAGATSAPASSISKHQTATAVFAGGCFWGVEAVFEHVNGVENVVSGYAGGSRASAYYPIIGTGRTDHAEAVRVVYDPQKVSYGELLKVFFTVAHDPTQLNRQGPDQGPQYRSAIFPVSQQQASAAKTFIAQLDAARVFSAPIVTRIETLKPFYLAEDYHQDYARLNPNDRYIVVHDAPKVANLKRMFPDLYRGG